MPEQGIRKSSVADIVARTKSGYSTSRVNYAAELVCGRLTGRAADTYQSPAMSWGLEKEAEARRLYAFEQDAAVRDVGFLDQPLRRRSRRPVASPKADLPEFR